ncbi:MAG TPA: NAD(P)/FAD-dependent oxidoreductase [Pseudobdellovibrionaceae bacterium]|jgi:monoamine oxidase
MVCDLTSYPLRVKGLCDSTVKIFFPLLPSQIWIQNKQMARSLDFKKIMGILQEESEEFSSDRRAFLKKMVYSPLSVPMASLALAGCSSFDSWVIGDNKHLDQEVMVLGGGLAGLSAAYHLKKNKIPYKVYEASSRVGGRIQTLFHANEDEQFAELGAEFFEASHELVIQLCKELNLSTQDISYDPKLNRSLYCLNGKVVNEKDFRKNLKPLALKLAQLRRESFASFTSEINPRALAINPSMVALDQMSLFDFVNPLHGTMDEATLQSFENLCISEWGADLKNINLLHFLVKLDVEERSSAASPQKIFRVQGGMARIVQTLGERVQGIVPNLTLKLEHQLIAIREKSGGYECTFKTTKGSDTVWARQMICTLPFSLLKEVDGIQSLDLGRRKDFIANSNYGTHAKVICSFKDSFWKKKQNATLASQGVFRGQLAGQSYWDSSRGQAGTHGLLTSQRGGSVGQSTGASAAQQIREDLQCFYKEPLAEENFHLSNWSQKPFAKGSRLNLLPGTYLKYLEILLEEKELEGFYIGGEHWSFAHSGTMNGAIETGVAAAEKALKKAFFNGVFK